MIYVTADLHGYPLKKFLNLLDRAGFGDGDFLFVLGDVIDRGSDGAALLRWLTEQPNVQLILGNHEAFLLSCDYLFQPVTDESLEQLDPEKLRMLTIWKKNGADPTLSGLKKILKSEPEVMEGILDYLRDAPLYDTVEAGGKTYILVHGGLGNFRPDRPLSDYTPHELLWTRPTLDTRYFDNATVIFGHTPTVFFGEEFAGKALHGHGWICIDSGAAMGGSPMLLRLDDEKEFYIH
jgi:serine/threonine protein phosphatase 1